MATPLTLDTSKHLEKIEIPYLKSDFASNARFENPSSPTLSSNQMFTSRSKTNAKQAWKRVEELILMKGCKGFVVRWWVFELVEEKMEEKREREGSRQSGEEEGGFLVLIHYTTHTYPPHIITPQAPNSHV